MLVIDTAAKPQRYRAFYFVGTSLTSSARLWWKWDPHYTQRRLCLLRLRQHQPRWPTLWYNATWRGV